MRFLPEKQALLFLAAASLFLTACEEQPILTTFNDQSMHLDTATFFLSNLVTYQTPPDIGGHDYLYFGKTKGYDNPYALVQISAADINSNFNMVNFNDSLFTVDSMVFFLHYGGDSTNALSSYQLRWFPAGGDSVFSESATNYLNFDKTIASGIISTADLEIDSSDTSFSKMYLRFNLSPDIMKIFSDTSTISHNRTFLIEPVEDLTDLYKFNSRNNLEGRGPELKVHFRVADSTSIDTLESTFRPVKDASIIIPAPLAAADSLVAVSRGKGLNMIAYLDLGDLDLPLEAIVKSANLVLFPKSVDSIANSVIITYPLNQPADISSFNSFDQDPLELNINYFVTTEPKADRFEIQERSFFQGLAHEKVSNYGFKLSPSINNNPFETIYFHGVDSDSLYPMVKVEYVVP